MTLSHTRRPSRSFLKSPNSRCTGAKEPFVKFVTRRSLQTELATSVTTVACGRVLDVAANSILKERKRLVNYR